MTWGGNYPLLQSGTTPIILGSTPTFQLDAVLNGAPWPLAGATVTLILIDPSQTPHNFTATITNALGGIAQYVALSTDITVIGTWQKLWNVVQGANNQTSLPEPFLVTQTNTIPQVISSVVPYASAADMSDRFDARTLGQLCSDSNVPIGLVNGQVVATTLATIAASSPMQSALMTASGQIESACLVGGRYSAEDLLALESTASGMLLRQLTCDLAMMLLIRRRPNYKVPVPESYTQSQEFMQLLAAGERIFGLQDPVSAGTLVDDRMSPIDFRERGEISARASPLFGRRNQYIPRYPYGAAGGYGGGFGGCG
jgi:phage gp36-like protein